MEICRPRHLCRLPLKDDEGGEKTKAVVAWLNSSMRTTLMVKHSSPSKGGEDRSFYKPRHKHNALRSLSTKSKSNKLIKIRVPRMMTMVADNEYLELTLDRIGNITTDRLRAKLNRLFAEALKIKGDFGQVARDDVRFEMSFMRK